MRICLHVKGILVFLLCLMLLGCQSESSSSFGEMTEEPFNMEDDHNRAKNKDVQNDRASVNGGTVGHQAESDEKCEGLLVLDEDEMYEKPVYLDESEYDGEEKELVHWFNRYMRAFFENDAERYAQLLVESERKRLRGWIGLDKEIFEITYIEFDPETDLPEDGVEDYKSVWVHMIERVPRETGCFLENRKVFWFTKESDEWKLGYQKEWFGFPDPS